MKFRKPYLNGVGRAVDFLLVNANITSPFANICKRYLWKKINMYVHLEY